MKINSIRDGLEKQNIKNTINQIQIKQTNDLRVTLVKQKGKNNFVKIAKKLSIKDKDNGKDPLNKRIFEKTEKKIIEDDHPRNKIFAQDLLTKYPTRMTFEKNNNFFKDVVVEILQDVLNNVFKPDESGIEKLNEEEKIFIFLFLLRKRKKHRLWEKCSSKRLTLHELIYFIRKFDKDFISLKRFEENFKFLFKHSLVFFKKKLELNKKIPCIKGDRAVYQYYFSEISKSMKIPLENFMDPSINRKEKSCKIKTFGRKYLQLICFSEKFRRDFINFIKNDVKDLYLKRIENKLNSIVKWLSERYEFRHDLVFCPDYTNGKKKNQIENKLFLQKNEFEKKYEIIVNYLIHNNQCKLPWSLAEINFARMTILEKIEKSNSF